MNPHSNALILLAHGSRDPLWKEGVEKTAKYIAEQEPQTAVKLAFIELSSPTLLETVRELQASDITQATVLPLFISAGAHVLKDIPNLIADTRDQVPEVALQELPIIGQSSLFASCLHQVFKASQT